MSDKAKDLIKQLMEPDPAERIAADEMLVHPWVQVEF